MRLLLQYIVETIHQKVNRKKILAKKEEISKLYKDKHTLVTETKRLLKMNYENECLVLEINRHLSKGGRLLGIHEFVRKGLEGNPESKDKLFKVYYIFHTPKDSDFFYLRDT